MGEVSVCLNKHFYKVLAVPEEEWSEKVSGTLKDAVAAEVGKIAQEMIAKSNRGGWARIVEIGEAKEWDNYGATFYDPSVPLMKGWRVSFYTGITRCPGASRISRVVPHRNLVRGDVIHV